MRLFPLVPPAPCPLVLTSRINLLSEQYWGMGMMEERNLVRELTTPESRWEILDWYHLRENLYKVGGCLKRLKQAESLLWQGRLDEAKALFADCRQKQAKNFCNYLEKHRHRIVNYQYFQTEQICSIGSGAVESAVKQIDRRLKISGAQWNLENVNQMLQLRTCYLNGLLAI